MVTDALQKQYATSLSTINQSKKNRISDYFAQVESTLASLGQSIVKDSVGIVSTTVAPDEETEISLPTTGNLSLNQLVEQNFRIHHIYVVTPAGRIMYASDLADKKKG